ncbi:MAG: DUF4255 domain-containing protein [Desulfobacterales bacterium]|nr:DUF4255 domain-containing protein [Desulfobacterales bacterium]
MSTSLGIAAVTAVLREILTNRFSLDPVSSSIGAVSVSTGAPDKIDLSGASDPNQVNIFLYQVSHNQGWRNVDLPSRNSRGQVTNAPPLALDLHYLITVYGEQPFYSEILLGEVVQEFHQRAVPDRQVIDQALNPDAPAAGFPVQLAQSGLARQIERIRITPEVMSREEVSKLWPALQASYRTTLAYHVSTVIIESIEPARPSLPVLQRLGYAFNQATPVIHSVQPQEGADSPIIAGSTIVVTGSDFEGSNTIVEIQDLDFTGFVEDVADSSITIALPDPLPAGIHAGINSLKVAHRELISDPEELRKTSVSNLGVFVITPVISDSTVTIDSTDLIEELNYRTGSLEIETEQPITEKQSVFILLHPADPTASGARAYRLSVPDGNGITAPATETGSVTVQFSQIPTMDYMIRIEVDGAVSSLTVDGDGVFNGPVVTI